MTKTTKRSTRTWPGCCTCEKRSNCFFPFDRSFLEANVECGFHFCPNPRTAGLGWWRRVVIRKALPAQTQTLARYKHKQMASTEGTEGTEGVEGLDEAEWKRLVEGPVLAELGKRRRTPSSRTKAKPTPRSKKASTFHATKRPRTTQTTTQKKTKPKPPTSSSQTREPSSTSSSSSSSSSSLSHLSVPLSTIQTPISLSELATLIIPLSRLPVNFEENLLTRAGFNWLLQTTPGKPGDLKQFDQRKALRTWAAIKGIPLSIEDTGLDDFPEESVEEVGFVGSKQGPEETPSSFVPPSPTEDKEEEHHQLPWVGDIFNAISSGGHRGGYGHGGGENAPSVYSLRSYIHPPPRPLEPFASLVGDGKEEKKTNVGVVPTTTPMQHQQRRRVFQPHSVDEFFRLQERGQIYNPFTMRVEPRIY